MSRKRCKTATPSISEYLAETAVTIRELEIILCALEQGIDFGLYDEQGNLVVNSDEVAPLLNKLQMAEALADSIIEASSPEIADGGQQRMYDLMEGADMLSSVSDELDGTVEDIEYLID